MEGGESMKRVLVVAAMLAASVVSAEEIRDRMEFHNDNGVVVFYHNNHANEVKGECKVCHGKAPGRIEGFGKEYAHKNCIPCHDGHDGMPEGPTRCEGCHKK
jgi:hypothetical protein